ncbi:hypothetical protein Gpo141_00011642 [Globisporangium polare]
MAALKMALLATTAANASSKAFAQRTFSSSRTMATPWNLFPIGRQAQVAPPQAPLYLSDWRHNFEFFLEKMRLDEAPSGMQLLNRNARRPKKANHGKRPCSHHRRRLKRLSRRS